MSIKFVLIIFIFALISFPAAGSEVSEGLVLAVGQQHLISQTSKIHRVAIGDASVLKAKSLKKGKELLLTGLRPGETDFTMWYRSARKSFRVHVLAQDSEQLIPAMKAFLGDIEGVSLHRVGDKFFIRGVLLRPADKSRISKLTENHPKVIDLTRVHPKGLVITGKAIQARLASAHLDNVDVATSDQTLLIAGVVKREDDLKKVKALVDRFAPEASLDVEVDPNSGSMLLMDLRMVEVRKQALKKLGIRWQDRIEVALTANVSGQSRQATLGTTEGVPVALETLENKGFARTLSNPRLSCRFGEACHFHAGGEFPIALVGERTTSVEFKPYGARITLTPSLKPQGDIHIIIDVEFSSLDFSSAVGDIPGLLKNSVKTSATTGFDRSIVLSGIVNRVDSKVVDKLPVLGSIPVLGELFKSRSFVHNDSEFLLMLTPIRIQAGGHYNQRLIRKQMNQYVQFREHMRTKLKD